MTSISASVAVVGICLLVWPLFILGHPATVKSTEGESSGGGLLAQMRRKHGLKAGVIEVTMREGHTLDDLELPAPAELVSILHHEGRTYTAIVKVTAPEGMLELFRKFDLDLIWDTPMALSQVRVTLSVIGEEEDLKRVLEIWESIGTVEEVTFQRPSFHPEDVLDALTVRQREVLTAAKRYGYYDYPRRMNA